MKKQILFLLFFTSLFSAAQNPLVKIWDKRYGGTWDEWLTSFQQTKDGGYIVGGGSLSGIGGDKTQDNFGAWDYWVVKIDSIGNKKWDKDFGGMYSDNLNSLEQTSDGGYILGGVSESGISGNKMTPLVGGADYWIVKIDSLGNKLWEKDFGGTQGNILNSLRQTKDGGYILGGTSNSGISGDKTQSSQGGDDFWIIKVDSLGNMVWDKDFGGTNYDVLTVLDETADGGYLLGGYSWSGIGGDKTQANWDPSQSTTDYWIVKVDSLGNKQWDKDFGGTKEDRLYSLQQTFDGGYILAGGSFSSISGDKTKPNWDLTLSTADNWIIKIDSLGNKEWDQIFGGTNMETGEGNVSQTIDGGYLIAGLSNSNSSGDKTENNLGYVQPWLVKTDSFGIKEWDKTILIPGSHNYGGLAEIQANAYFALVSYPDGGIGGYKTEANWDTICQPMCSHDYWIVKFCDSTLTTNISNTEKTNDQLLLWPNPTTGELKINNSKLKIDRIEILNAIGERLYYETANCESCIVNCESFPPGIYFVKATSGDKVFFEKIIKQ